jgi:hypothetical protein
MPQIHSPSAAFACDEADIHRMTTEIILAPSPDLQPAPLFTPTPKAAKRVLEFFTGQINNDHTRRACMNATRRFAAWCAQKNLDELSSVQPFHVAAFIKDLQAEVSPPTVKQHLAALRMLFDWLVTGHVIDVNPVHSVRGPKYVGKKGKTPVLTAHEARTLLDSIPIVPRSDRPHGLQFRPRRCCPADEGRRYFVQGRRRWVRLHEKGGKEHDVPCHHNLDHFLGEYIAAAGIAGDADGYLFRTTLRKSGVLRENPMHQPDAYRMIRRRERGRHRDEDWQPYLPRAGHHRLSEEQRKAGSGAAYRQS